MYLGNYFTLAELVSNIYISEGITTFISFFIYKFYLLSLYNLRRAERETVSHFIFSWTLLTLLPYSKYLWVCVCVCVYVWTGLLSVFLGYLAWWWRNPSLITWTENMGAQRKDKFIWHHDTVRARNKNGPMKWIADSLIMYNALF